MIINGEKLAWAIICLIMVISIVFSEFPEISNVYGNFIYFIIMIAVGIFAIWRFIENMKGAFN